MIELESILREKCGLCEHCVQIYICGSSNGSNGSNDYKTNKKEENDDGKMETLSCPLCLDLLSKYTDVFQYQLNTKLKEKIRPYANFYEKSDDSVDSSDQKPCAITTPNSISKDSPTIVLPNIILVIAHCINCVIEEVIEQRAAEAQGNSENDKEKLLQYKPKKVADVYNVIKDSLRAKARSLILDINAENNDKISYYESKNVEQWQRQQKSYSKSQHDEEAGYLKFHLIFTPPLSFPFLPFVSSTTASRQGIFSLPPLSTKRDRKRFRGNDPVAKQGGDPRNNLNSFVKMDLSSFLTKHETTIKVQKSIVEGNTHCCFLEKNTIVKHLDTIGSRNHVKKQLSHWFLEKISTFRKGSIQVTGTTKPPGLDDAGIYISCWRNHFHLKGKYTKSRRDVSQTPFYVNVDENDHVPKSNVEVDDKRQQTPKEEHDKNTNHNRMKKLGTTSVEEEICPIISIACRGISTENNEQRVAGYGKSNSSNLVYGMCKFHASGREDMDVRMILPESTKADFMDKKKNVGSGRPFVCEVIDAYKLPSIQDLAHAVQKINQNGNADDYGELSALEEITLASDEKWVKESPRKHIQYGVNPKGVGISGLSYCHSSSFGNLQSETEDKVKFYGCLCWSHKTIPNQAFLEEKVINCGVEGASIYPLQIEQSTPLRVLHRRSAASRTRHVLSLHAQRIDDHFFRLHLSTSAGTYVKEFCHGDCGRSKPSISSLLGCKTDILELDCEGIAIS